MKFNVLVAALLVSLSGCSLTPTKPVEVKVPVVVPCKVPTVTRPAMPLDSAKVTDSLTTKAKLALSEIEVRQAYELQLETNIKACQ